MTCEDDNDEVPAAGRLAARRRPSLNFGVTMRLRTFFFFLSSFHSFFVLLTRRELAPWENSRFLNEQKMRVRARAARL